MPASEFTSSPKGEVGVDLNRNYGHKWGVDDEGSSPDPCDETFRGAGPFSEAETQAVRSLVEESGRVASAMNFHAWGNLWITPFSYSKDPNYETLMEPRVYRFYRAFEKRLNELGYRKAGNAEETINYVANGEASDWMLAAHGIISFSPELGNDRPEDDVFYPSKDGIVRVVEADYAAIQLFLDSNVVLATEPSFGYSDSPREAISAHIGGAGEAHRQTVPLRPFVISFVNSGIVDLRDARLVLNLFRDDIVGLLDRIELSDGSGGQGGRWTVNGGLRELSPSFPVTVRRLSKLEVTLWLKEEASFEFALRVFKDGREVVRVTNVSESSLRDLVGQIWQGLCSTALVIVWLLGFVGLFAVAVWLVWSSKKRRQKQRIVEMIEERPIDI